MNIMLYNAMQRVELQSLNMSYQNEGEIVLQLHKYLKESSEISK